LIGGEAAPAFVVSNVIFSGITAAGAGEFILKLDCEENIVGSGAAASCKGQNISDLRYRLVEDIFGGVLSHADAQALFSSGAISIDPASEVLPIGDPDAPHGGFTSKTITGPAQMHLHPNMILIIEASGSSYRYYN